MENSLTKPHISRLIKSGLTVEQAEAILHTIEQRAVSIKDLDLLKKDLKLWTLGIMITGFVFFAGFISYLDSKTNTRFDEMNERFNRIEADIKTLLLISSPNRSQSTKKQK